MLLSLGQGNLETKTVLVKGWSYVEMMNRGETAELFTAFRTERDRQYRRELSVTPRVRYAPLETEVPDD